jgi:uroporphyrinogen decarboxylase
LVAGGQELERRAGRILDAFAGRPHVFNLGHGIDKETPMAHVERLLAVVRG